MCVCRGVIRRLRANHHFILSRRASTRVKQSGCSNHTRDVQAFASEVQHQHHLKIGDWGLPSCDVDSLDHSVRRWGRDFNTF